MAKSLPEYFDSLAERSDLKWPQAAARVPIKATPAIKPIEEIRAVAWSLYGTLLTIDGGRLLHVHPQQMRMQIALQKTIEEFKMWHSMSRKPGQPWEYLLIQYTKLIEEQRLRSTGRKGDIPEIDSAAIWKKLIERLQRNEFTYDTNEHGDLDDFAVKVAYFFHANLQGVAPAAGAIETLVRLLSLGLPQAIFDDAQAFSLEQALRAFQKAAPVRRLGDAISHDGLCLSYQLGVRKPSPSFYEHAVKLFKKQGIKPAEVLYVSHRLKDDLSVAKQLGFRTVLAVCDKNCTQVDNADVRNPDLRPDRLITEIPQVAQILGL